MPPAITLHVHFFGDTPTFTVSVRARYPATFYADLLKHTDDNDRTVYAVCLRGVGIPKLIAESTESAVHAAMQLGHIVSAYLDEIDDRLSTEKQERELDKTPVGP